MRRMANNLESVIHSIVSRVSSEMAQEIVHIVRRTIADEIAGSHSPSPSISGGKRAPGRPRKAGANGHDAQPRRGKGSRRSSADVAADDSKILAHVKAHPGLRSIEIGKAIKMAKTSMASGLLRLRAAKKIKTKGQRSATTYSA